MIKVKESIILNEHTVILICDLFDDEIVTSEIRSDIGIHKDFEVEKTKKCFSNPRTRNIAMFGNRDCAIIKNLEFV